MRYEDSSQTSGQSDSQSQPIDARDDSDALTAGSRGPATGNIITGEGTQTGSVGADLANSEAQITAISGAGGSDSSFAGGKLQVGGEFGRLSIDADGNYNYIANANTPENSRDRFTYTLSDGQGNRDTADLTIEFGKTQSAMQANAQQVVPGPDGVVILPPGVELSDIRVVGRNLVIDLPDGTQMVIVDGAVFVPQLVLGTVEVPADNLAALLIGQEPQPAAGGQPLSSGGNFAVPVGPLDPGVPLGDLLPPTELFYQPPEVREVLDELDREPDVVIVTPDQPAGAEDATASVNEGALGPRGAEPQGSGEEAAAGPNGDPRETTTGTIVIDSPDEPNSTTINGVLVTGVGQVIPGTFGSLTITSITPDAIGYSYTLTTDTTGDATRDLFTVIVTDTDGDTDTATLTVNIVDDVPTARPDTDSIAAGGFGPATGNVITDASAGDVGDSDTNAADTLGADGATLTSASGAGGSDSTFDSAGNLVVNGQYGVLTIRADGSYSYVRNPGTQGGVTDTFNYTLTDGDGDTSSSTLAISIGDVAPTLTLPVGRAAGTQVSEVGLPARNGEPAGSGEAADGNGADNDDASETTAGTIAFTEGDGPATVSINGTDVTAVGQAFTVPGVGTLTITSIAPGAIGYSFTLTDNTSGDNTSVTFAVSVRDQDGDTVSGDGVIRIEDDRPVAEDDADSVTEDGPLSTDGNVISGANTDSGAAGADTPGADGGSVQAPGSYAGAYGTLVINADGSYVYTLYTAAENAAAAATVQGLSAGDTLNDSFGYVLVDGDGDTDPATLVITINGADDGVTINGLDGQAPEEVVREDDLADGSSPDAAALTQGGTFSFTAGDGLNDVTVGGVLVIDGGVFQGVQTITDAKGTLTITGFTPLLDATGAVVGGTLAYTYQLTDNTLLHTGAADGALTQSFTVVVNDTDGSSDTDSLDVQIIDDRPVAEDDADSVTEDGPLSTDGNVISGANTDSGAAGADTPGADGGSVQAPGSYAGAYGTLVINADGSYVYTLYTAAENAAAAATVQGLSAGDTLNDSFGYVLVDGDGDTDPATLVITINGADDGVTINGLDGQAPEEVVREDDLADGSSPDAAALTQGGTFSFTAGDGLNDVTVGGVLVIDGGVFQGVQTITDAKGTLTITGFTPLLDATGAVVGGTLAYTYQLTDNTLLHTGAADGALTQSFTVVVNDTDGSSDTDSLDVQIIDDRPVAEDDADSVTEDGPLSTDGNVISGANTDSGAAGADTPGADGGSVQAPGSYAGAYGTLVINADGSYVYTLYTAAENAAAAATVQGLSAGDTLNDSFGYVLVDGDGDTDPATLVITINGADDGVTINGLDGQAPEEVVREDDLADGSSPDAAALTQGGTFSFTAGDGLNDVTVGGVLVIDGGVFQGVQTITDAKGTLTITGFTPLLDATGAVVGGTLAYTYQLTDNTLLHTGAADGALTQSFTVVVNDTDGSSDTDSLDVQIIDDVPTGVDDFESQTVENGNVRIVVFDNDEQGADGALASTVQLVPGSQVGGGMLTNNGDGSFTLDPADGQTGQVTFQYTFLDNDGDVGTATATITLLGDSLPSVVSTTNVTVDEDGFGNANVDATPLQADPAEVNSNESLIQTGTAVVNFGNDTPGAPLINSIVLVDTAALDGQLQLLNGAAVTFAPGAGGTLVGSAGGTEVIRISITAAVAGPGPGQVSYTYQVQLLQPVEHVAGGGENNAFLNDVTFEVTDADGDKAQGSFDVTVVDDVPTANSEPMRTVAEDAVGTIGGNVITDTEGNGGADQLGADGGLLTSVTIGATTTAVAASGITTVTTAIGVYTFTSAGAWTFDPAPGQNNASPINAGFTYTITDGDGDQATATQPIQITDGAGPIGGDSVQLDLDDQNLANGRTPAGPDFETDTVDFTAGSDAIATIAFGTDLSLLNSTNLTWSRISDTEIRGTDTATGALVVTLTLVRNGDDATVTATLNNNYDAHPTINVDDLVNLGSVQVIATDIDGDVAEGTVNVSVSDDIPTIGTTSNVTLAMTTSTTGSFPFSINADDYPAGTAASTFLSASLAGTVGSTAITVTQQPTYVSTTGGVATYQFAFTYDSDPTSTSDAPVANTGTINFNIGAGTYTVTLTNPIQTFDTSQTSQTIAKFSFNLEGSDSQSEVVVSQLETDLFVQFTGDADSNSTPLVAGSTAPGTFTNGEILTAGQTWVSISNAENGVAGDTIQGGEVLDFNLYSSNPGSNTTLAPTAQATGMTLRLDGVGSEDFVVILKLFDTVTMTYTTKAVIIGSNDIYRSGDTIPTGYGLSSPLDNNDGFVIIEANDYQQGNSNLVIVGAQLISSTEDIGGSGIDLNRATGTSGGSTSTQLFGTVDNATTDETSDQDVVKIVDIGLTRSVTNTQSLSMDFTVTVRDFDNDTATTHLLVNAPTATTTSSSKSTAASSESLLVFDGESSLKVATGDKAIAANSNMLAMTAAAVGLDSQAAARHVPDDGLDDANGMASPAQFAGREFFDHASDDEKADHRSTLANDLSESVDALAQAASTGHGEDMSVGPDDALTGTPANDAATTKDTAAAADPGPVVMDAPASLSAATDVSMPSAEALVAASLDGAQQAESVERVLADSIGAMNGASAVDALLDGLPGNGTGGLEALQALASHGADGVPAWDIAGHGAFHPGSDMLFRVEAVMLHHDAVQPVANG